MKTIVFTNTLFAAFLVSVMISGHAHAGGSGNPYPPSTGDITHVYMTEKAASAINCNYKGMLGGMHKYECRHAFELKSHGVTSADGYYRTCTFFGRNDPHELKATEHAGYYCGVDGDSSGNTFYATVRLPR